MSRRKYKSFLRILVSLLIVVFLATGVELLFNIDSLHSDESNSVREYVEVTKEKDNLYHIMHVEFDDAEYIGEITIEGYMMRDTTFSLSVEKMNGFEKGEVSSSNKLFKADKKELVFPVQSKVLSYDLYLYSNIENFYIRNVTETSGLRFNFYRFLLVSVTAFLFLFLIERKEIKSRIVLFFVIASLGLGSIEIVSTGIRNSTWDEMAHFYFIYQMATGDTNDWSEAAWKIYNKDIPDYNMISEKFDFENEMDDYAMVHKYHIERNYSTVPLSKMAYIPASAVFKLGSLLNLKFTYCYELMKLTNLLIYTTAIAIAINISQTKKLFIATVSLLPTVLFQGSMLTYDGFVYSLITLGVVLIANEIETPKLKINKSNIIWAILLIVLGAASKAIYVPLVLLVLLIPKDKFENRRQYWIFNSGILVLLIAMMSTFLLPTLMNTVSRNVDFGGDYRGGDTGSVKQLISMIKHPLATVKLYIENIFAFDNLRNMGTALYDNYLFSNLLFLSIGFYGVMPDKWSLLLIPILCILFFYSESENAYIYKKWSRVFIGTVVFAIVGMIWSALYLSFTTIGNTGIDGVQARYYLPLLLPTSFVIFGNKVALNFKRDTIWKIVLALTVIIEFNAIYNLIIMVRVL